MPKKKPVTKASIRTKKKTTPAVKSNSNAYTKWLVVLLVLIIVGGFFAVNKTNTTKPTPVNNMVKEMTFNFGDQKIMLNEQELNFVNGSYTSSDPTMGTHVANISNRSINPTGDKAAAILVDEPGGSGTFSYLVGASLKDGKEAYSVPVLLGDRVKIVSVTVDDAQAEDNGMITVEYLARAEDAPMVAEPTEKMTVKYAFQDDGNLITVLN